MRPILFSVGSFHISAFGLFTAIAFLIGTFFVWRYSRDARFSEEKILNSVFTTAFYAFLTARLFYMVAHFDVFSLSLLRFFLVWKFPGFSMIGGLLGGLVGIFISSKKERLVFWHLFDIYALSFLPFMTIFAIGSLFDGSEIGKQISWGAYFVGYAGKRHVLGAYEAVFAFVSYFVFRRLYKKFEKKKYPFGIMGLFICLWVTLFLFSIAFAKEDTVVFGHMSTNQLIFAVFSIVVIGLLYYRLRRNVIVDVRLIRTKLSQFVRRRK